MDADESLICTFLKLYHGQFVSAHEVCRRADTRKRYHRDRHWAVPALKRLVERKVLESDATGHYRLVPPREKAPKRTKWVSPQVQKILAQSGKTFDVISPGEDTGRPEQHYDG